MLLSLEDNGAHPLDEVAHPAAESHERRDEHQGYQQRGLAGVNRPIKD